MPAMKAATPPPLDTAAVRELMTTARQTPYVATMITIGRSIDAAGYHAILHFERDANGKITGVAITTDFPRPMGVTR